MTAPLIHHTHATRLLGALLALAVTTTAAGAQNSAAPRASQPSASSSAGLVVHAENPLAIDRHDETIAIAWSELRRQLPDVQPTRVRVVDPASGREVLEQVLDADADGTPDSLLFQASFLPNEAKVFVIEPVASTLKPERRVYAKHIDERDDVAWENDRIAYRIYGQGLWKVEPLKSSGIDIWVKKVRYMIIDKWYDKGHDSYHRDTGEGADFFNVGETLGAGGTAIWRGDSMYRALNFKSWKILANGPIRAIFELQYDPVDAKGLKVAETKRISIDGGQNLFRQESIFRAEGGATDIPYVIGLVKRKGMIGSESKAQQWAWLAGWGAMDFKMGEGGHGDLGTGVLLESNRIADWKEDAKHYFAVTHAKSGVPVVHYIGAGWTDSGDFKNVNDWWSYLTAFAQRLESPLKVTLSRGAAAMTSSKN